MLAAISMARLRGEDGRSETGIRAVDEFATNSNYSGTRCSDVRLM